MGKHRETDQHLAGFEVWYEKHRDFEESGKSLSVSHQTVRNWAARFDWEARADRRDAAAAKKAEREAIDRRAGMLRRHRQAAELLVGRGTEFFANHKPDRASDAISAIKTGVDLERQAEGMPGWVVEILNADEDTLRQRFEDLDARRRAAMAGVPDSAGDTLAYRNGKPETAASDL